MVVKTLKKKATTSMKLPSIKLSEDLSTRVTMSDVMTAALFLEKPVKPLLDKIEDDGVRELTELVLISSRAADEGKGKGFKTMEGVIELLKAGMDGGDGTYSAVLSCLLQMDVDKPDVFGQRVRDVSKRYKVIKSRVQKRKQ